MVVGLLKVFKGTPSWFYAQPWGFLAGAYVILAFPYMFFSLDAGFRSIDVHTLTEASHSLGARWGTTLLKVILPNIRSAALAGSFLTLAIVMGEFTIANLSDFHTFPIFIQYVNESQGFPAASLTLLSFGITWAAMAVAARRRTQTRPAGRHRGRSALMAFLELQDLHRDFGTNKALDGIEIALGEGEFLSLLGPSGCGKTTALRLVAGFDRPDQGRIVVDGRDVTRVAPNKRDMGMVFQAYSLFPNMTAHQNVEFGLKIRGKDRTDRRKRVDDLLELVGLGHAGTRYPHQLSGGMQQRVALARALAIEPRVLLLDEPLSALDAKVRVQLREEIRRIQLELGITTLYVTHDQEEALSVSDHVAVMYRGRIEQMGSPAEMYTAPATPFVAEFIGTMNRLEATVVDPATGAVETGGVTLTVEAARGKPRGARVLVLIRPETVDVTAANGAGANTLTGEVLTHTFLGPVTRLRIDGAGASLIADMPTARAAALPPGSKVDAALPATEARLLDLTDERCRK